jgi:hypothetical protein
MFAFIFWIERLEEAREEKVTSIWKVNTILLGSLISNCLIICLSDTILYLLYLFSESVIQFVYYTF